jgi:sugar lactone lactonase YvrE
MKTLLLILLTAILFPALSIAQQLSSPESIAYYPAGDYYLVSNAGNGTIYKYSTSGEISSFATGLIAPKGITIVYNYLYVADVTNLVGFNLTTGSKIFTVPITGSTFLNDICYDGLEMLYLTDTQKNSIFKYSVTNKEVSTLQLKGTLIAPNGIIYKDKKLFGVSMILKSPVWQIDLTTNNITTLKSTELDYLDGIQSDGNGNIYVSAWINPSQSGAGAVYRIKDDFSGEFEKVIDGLSGPADILINNNKLYIPEMNANKITVADLNSVKEKKIIKSPSTGLIEFPAELEPPYFLEVYDMSGNKVLEKVTEQSEIYLDFPVGIYFLKANNQITSPILIIK